MIMVIVYFLYAMFLWQNKRIEKFVYYKVGDKESYEKRFNIFDYSLTDKEDNKVGNAGRYIDTVGILIFLCGLGCYLKLSVAIIEMQFVKVKKLQKLVPNYFRYFLKSKCVLVSKGYSIFLL